MILDSKYFSIPFGIIWSVLLTLWNWDSNGHLSSFLCFMHVSKARKAHRLFAKMNYIEYFRFGNTGTLNVFDKRDNLISWRLSITYS